MLREERTPTTLTAVATREYRTRDKTGWGAGPWQDEPDKISWIDPATDLDCLIVRNHAGALCGYVGVSEAHPWFDKHYGESVLDGGDLWSNTPDGFLEVHGGISYSDRCQEGDDEATGICHVALPGRPEPIWWFGFDASHAGDFSPAMHADLCRYDALRDEFGGYVPGIPQHGEEYRTVAYVRAQVTSLAAQLAAVAEEGAGGR